MKSTPLLFLPLLLCLTAAGYASRECVVSQGSLGTFNYSLIHFKSKDSEEYPLLLALHGRGWTGSQYLEIWKEEACRRGVMVVAPTRRRSYRNDKENLSEFHELMEKVSADFPVDRNRFFLAGVSSGALIARWLVLQQSSYWKGAVLIASPTGEDWVSSLGREKNFPSILFVHGAKDEQFNIEEILKYARDLQTKGIKAHLLKDPEGVHEHRAEWSKEIFDWIEAEDYS